PRAAGSLDAGGRGRPTLLPSPPGRLPRPLRPPRVTAARRSYARERRWPSPASGGLELSDPPGSDNEPRLDVDVYLRALLFGYARAVGLDHMARECPTRVGRGKSPSILHRPSSPIPTRDADGASLKDDDTR